MKTKETFEPKSLNIESTLTTKAKSKSLRPMRSLMATRSLKPRTMVANMILKNDEDKKN